MNHSIFDLGGNKGCCTCGFTGDTMTVLGHALPLNTRSLADTVAADPNSDPELVARAEALAQEAEGLVR